jgi:hypothetical protein
MSKVIWSQNMSVSKAKKFSPFRLLFRAEAVTQEEIKHKSSQTMSVALPCPTEFEDEDLLKSCRLKAVTNLQKYQA